MFSYAQSERQTGTQPGHRCASGHKNVTPEPQQRAHKYDCSTRNLHPAAARAGLPPTEAASRAGRLRARPDAIPLDETTLEAAIPRDTGPAGRVGCEARVSCPSGSTPVSCMPMGGGSSILPMGGHNIRLRAELEEEPPALGPGGRETLHRRQQRHHPQRRRRWRCCSVR